MGINTQNARKNSKGSVLFIIKDIRILHNYLIPFFDKLEFLSKKVQDFNDFKIITRAVYYGAHKEELIRSLILKLSRSTNNFRLSNYSGKLPAEFLTPPSRLRHWGSPEAKDARDILENALQSRTSFGIAKKKLTGGAMRRMLKRKLLEKNIGDKGRYYSTKSALLLLQ